VQKEVATIKRMMHKKKSCKMHKNARCTRMQDAKECKMHKKKSWHVLKKYEKEQRQKSLIFQTAATL
jgi:hypothetical protein